MTLIDVKMNQKNLDDLVSDVRLIKIALLGDKDAGIEGVINKVIEHDKQLKNIQRLIWSVGGGIAVIGSVLAIIKSVL